MVNDLGGRPTGEDDRRRRPPRRWSHEIRAAGGDAAVANSDSVADPRASSGMVELAMTTSAACTAVINTAGILRDGMFHKMSEADWDAVITVHLRGAFNVSRATIALFRDQGDGAYILFTSTSGLIGNIGQANYAAAKMGIVGLSKSIALDMARFGRALQLRRRRSPGRA